MTNKNEIIDDLDDSDHRITCACRARRAVLDAEAILDAVENDPNSDSAALVAARDKAYYAQIAAIVACAAEVTTREVAVVACAAEVTTREAANAACAAERDAYRAAVNIARTVAAEADTFVTAYDAHAAARAATLAATKIPTNQDPK